MAAKKSFSQNISTEAINPFFSQQEEPVEDIKRAKEDDPFGIDFDSRFDYASGETEAQTGEHIPFKRIEPETVYGAAVQPIHNAEPNPKEETKSKRVQLLIKPSLYENLEKVAYLRRQSKNDLINELIANLISEEQDSIERYDSMFPKE